MAVDVREIEIDGALVPDMQLTDHFWLSEFRLYWPRKVPKYDRFPVLCPDARTARQMALNLEVLRSQFGKPIQITDCLRPTWSLRYIPKAAKNSRHKTEWLQKGIMAVDLKIPGVQMRKVYNAAEKLMDATGAVRMQQGGLGYYTTHIHIDNRGTRTRW